MGIVNYFFTLFFFNQGISQEDAQEQYIAILKKWPGYNSTLFDVKVNIRLSA